MKLIGKLMTLHECSENTGSTYFNEPFRQYRYNWKLKKYINDGKCYELAVIKNVIVNRMGGIYSIDAKSHIDEMSYQGYLNTFAIPHTTDGKDRLVIDESDTIFKIDGPVFVLGGHNNYYHWIFNWAPRIMVLKLLINKTGYQFDDVKILVLGGIPENMMSSLKMLGVQSDQVIHGKSGCIFFCNTTILSNFFDKHCYYPDVLDNYQKMRYRSGHKMSPAIDLLFIDRNSLPRSRRKIHNHLEVFFALSKYNYKAVSLETMSFSEQIDLFSSSKVVVAAHGAGLSNLVFCKSNTSLILFEYKQVSEYEELARILGLSVYKIPTTQIRASDAPEDRLKDFYIDTALLERLLQSIMTKIPNLI